VVVAAVVETLLRARAEPQDITILVAPAGSGGEPARAAAALPPDVAQTIRVVQHDPRNAESLTYLAASKENKPIYVHRLLFDADFVVPLGCLRPADSLGYLGVHGGLFPAFSDEATQQRFRSPSSVETAVQRRRRREEAEEAAWLLGIQFTVQVVPGPGDTVLHVLAGDVRSVARRGQELCQAAWHYRVPRRASLVMAAIAGGPGQQTWESFARALDAACQVVDNDGDVVLCTELQCPPGPALQRLAEGADDAALWQQLHRERSPDAIAAMVLTQTLRRTRVYLYSGLDSDSVEALGLAYVAGVEEIQRLSRHHASCILLGDAHRATVEAADE
jgi:nickel-dependent lactate racemase